MVLNDYAIILLLLTRLVSHMFRNCFLHFSLLELCISGDRYFAAVVLLSSTLSNVQKQESKLMPSSSTP